METIERQYVRARPPYYIRCGCSLENPFGVPHDEVAQQIVDESAAYVAQVVFGLLVPDDGSIFNFDTVRWLFEGDVEAVKGAEYVDHDSLEQARVALERYGPNSGGWVAGADLARKKDASVIFVLDVRGVPHRPARVVYYRRLQRVPWPMVYAELGRASVLFGCTVLCDSTGIGDVVIDAVDGKAFCTQHAEVFPDGSSCPRKGPGEDCQRNWGTINAEGYVFTATSKVQLVTHLAQRLGHGFDPHRPDEPCGLVRSPLIPKLREQLQMYQYDDRKLETDDLFAFALAVWAGLHDLQGPAAVGSPWEGM